MRVGEIEAGKKACVIIDCEEVHVYYPPAGRENDPDAPCNCMELESSDEGDAVSEAAGMLNLNFEDIEVSYN